MEKQILRINIQLVFKSSKLENNLKLNRSTLIRLSFPTLDANNSEYYPLRAGLHCQSVLADRFHLEHQKSNFLVVNSFVPLRSGRTEEGRLRACQFLDDWSANPSSFCHHNHLAVIW